MNTAEYEMTARLDSEYPDVVWTDKLKAVKMLLAFSENKSPTFVSRVTGIGEQTVYRYMRKFKDIGLMNEERELIFSNKKIYPLPTIIVDGVVPVGNELLPFVHLASHLAKYGDEDIVPPYGMSKQQIKDLYNTMQTPNKTQLLLNLYEALAFTAIIQNREDVFKHMKGPIDPPVDLPWTN